MPENPAPQPALQENSPDAELIASVTTRVAASVVVLWTLAMLATSFGAHTTPLYYVETDLIGEYIPAAEEIASGTISPTHLSYKGPGYPLLLSSAMGLIGGDGFAGARALSVVGAGAAVWLGFRLATLWLAPGAALLTLGLMLVAPNMWRYAIEAGTDAPALALALLATWWLLSAPNRKQFFAAGIVTGLAILTRYNLAFLVPVALIVIGARRTRWGDFGAYAGGLIIPAAAWLAILIPWMREGFTDRNYLNIAYEIYGRTMSWEQFETTLGVHFGSIWDVVRYDPLRVATKIGTNLFAHRWMDLTQLMPWWLGMLAAPGVLLAARRPAWRAMGLHALLCMLVLAPVFYNARFALYLLPFYSACAAFTLSGLVDLIGQRTPVSRPWAAGLVTLPLIATGLASYAQTSDLLRAAPHEVRIAAASLRELGVHEGRILARKPHVAHFAGLDHAPLPAGGSLIDLLSAAKAEKADYLFYSAIERDLRPEYAVLAFPDAEIPGCELIDYRDLGQQKFYAVYRFDHERVDPEGVERATLAALLRRSERDDLTSEDRFFIAVQLIQRDRHDRAITILERLRQDGAADPVVEAALSTAHLGAGQLDASYQACRRAMALTDPTGWHHARLGAIRERQELMQEARAHYAAALRAEPGNVKHLERAGLIDVELRNFAAAAASFERCVRLDPDEPRYRRLAMDAYASLGDRGKMEMIFKDGVRVGIAPIEMLGAQRGRPLPHSR